MEEKKGGKKKERLMIIVATTSLPAVDRPNAERWNAACSRQKGGKKGEKTDDYSGHYFIASSRPPERRPLERRTFVPIVNMQQDFDMFNAIQLW